jgi:uncharacterized protein (TIGR00255 family)
MIKSMTGYGQAESLIQNRITSIELKSLNHRFLEVYVRLPASLGPLEPEIKKRITERFSRGRIEAIVRMEAEPGEEAKKVELNLPIIRKYYEQLVRLKEELNLGGDITLESLTGIKDAVIYSEESLDPAQAWESLQGVLDTAMTALEEMRVREGESIGRDLLQRVALISRHMDAVRERAPLVVHEYRKKLSDRIRELAEDIVLDENRLSQETAIMAERSDITEEIIRFASHTEQLAGLLKSGEAVGRKIDFLLQEMNREANTIGSKSNDAEISQRVVEIKTELSRLREQVQNVE